MLSPGRAGILPSVDTGVIGINARNLCRLSSLTSLTFIAKRAGDEGDLNVRFGWDVRAAVAG